MTNNNLQNSGISTTLQVDENDNLVLDFPSELIEAIGWKEGDLLNIEAFAGRIILSRTENQGARGGAEAN